MLCAAVMTQRKLVELGSPIFLRLLAWVLAAMAPLIAVVQGAESSRADDEAYLFTPAGFSRPGQAIQKPPATAGRLKITVRDARTGQPTFCRVNVVGADGNYYYPRPNYLTRFALTGQWTGKPPNAALGNRAGKAPVRYVGRFFYSWGQNEVLVPPGPVRVEVWKGLEYRPQVVATQVAKDETKFVEGTLSP